MPAMSVWMAAAAWRPPAHHVGRRQRADDGDGGGAGAGGGASTASDDHRRSCAMVIIKTLTSNAPGRSPAASGHAAKFTGNHDAIGWRDTASTLEPNCASRRSCPLPAERQIAYDTLPEFKQLHLALQHGSLL